MCFPVIKFTAFNATGAFKPHTVKINASLLQNARTLPFHSAELWKSIKFHFSPAFRDSVFDSLHNLRQWCCGVGENSRECVRDTLSVSVCILYPQWRRNIDNALQSFVTNDRPIDQRRPVGHQWQLIQTSTTGAVRYLVHEARSTEGKFRWTGPENHRFFDRNRFGRTTPQLTMAMAAMGVIAMAIYARRKSSWVLIVLTHAPYRLQITRAPPNNNTYQHISQSADNNNKATHTRLGSLPTAPNNEILHFRQLWFSPSPFSEWNGACVRGEYAVDVVGKHRYYRIHCRVQRMPMEISVRWAMLGNRVPPRRWLNKSFDFNRWIEQCTRFSSASKCSKQNLNVRFESAFLTNHRWHCGCYARFQNIVLTEVASVGWFQRHFLLAK